LERVVDGQGVFPGAVPQGPDGVAEHLDFVLGQVVNASPFSFRPGAECERSSLSFLARHVEGAVLAGRALPHGDRRNDQRSRRQSDPDEDLPPRGCLGIRARWIGLPSGLPARHRNPPQEGGALMNPLIKRTIRPVGRVPRTTTI
jgi:hypothetical protein